MDNREILFRAIAIHELYVKGEIGSLFIPSDNIEIIGTIHDHLLEANNGTLTI